MEKKVLEAVKHCFESNPAAQEFHVTSDGQCFFNENDAISHARSLHNKEVTVVDRKSMESKPSKGGNSNNVSEDDTPPATGNTKGTK